MIWECKERSHACQGALDLDISTWIIVYSIKNGNALSQSILTNVSSKVFLRKLPDATLQEEGNT